MGVDKTTPISYLNIIIPDDEEYLAQLRAQAEQDGQNEDLVDGDCKKMALVLDEHSITTEELYFDDAGSCKSGFPEIFYTGSLLSQSGESFVSVSIPLTDTVLLDVLEHCMKRFGKLKTAMEALK